MYWPYLGGSSFRYCGYCPQFKYQIGETFGRTTSHLLTTPDVASSGKLLLSDIVPQPPPSRDHRKTVIAPRSFKLGDQKLSDHMVPGYTGRSYIYLLYTFFWQELPCLILKPLFDISMTWEIHFYFVSFLDFPGKVIEDTYKRIYYRLKLKCLRSEAFDTKRDYPATCILLCC